MGFFNQVLGSVLGSSSTATPQGNGLQAVVDLIQHPSIGGLAGIAGLLQNGGLGHLMQGTGAANPGATGSQITQALGSGPVAEYAAKLGISPDQAATHLSQILPQVLSHLAPNGNVPSGGTSASTVMDLLRSKFGQT